MWPSTNKMLRWKLFRTLAICGWAKQIGMSAHADGGPLYLVWTMASKSPSIISPNPQDFISKVLNKFRCFWKCCKLSHTTNNQDMSPLGLMLLLLLWREISQHNLKHLTENLITEENLIKWSFKTPVQDLIGQLGLYLLRGGGVKVLEKCRFYTFICTNLHPTPTI